MLSLVGDKNGCFRSKSLRIPGKRLIFAFKPLIQNSFFYLAQGLP